MLYCDYQSLILQYIYIFIYEGVSIRCLSCFRYTTPSFPSSDPTPDWAYAHLILLSGGSFLHTLLYPSASSPSDKIPSTASSSSSSQDSIKMLASASIHHKPRAPLPSSRILTYHPRTSSSNPHPIIIIISASSHPSGCCCVQKCRASPASHHML